MHATKLNKQSIRRQNQRGSVLVTCMVLAALGTLGVAAWISLLDARGHQVEAGYSALKRRAALQSSKALALDAFYTNHLHDGNGLASDAVYTIPGDTSIPGTYTSENVAQATIRAYTPTPLANATATRTTKAGATPLRSFTTDVDVVLSDNVSSYSSVFQLRSYNPVLGGDLLSIHPVTNYDTSNGLVEGDVKVEGRAMFWDVLRKDFATGILADEYLLPNEIVGTTAFKKSDGTTDTLPLNYPIPLQTTGFASATPAYEGELDLLQSAANSHNEYAARLQATGNSLAMSGFTAQTAGPGPDTFADRLNDATLETDIATQDPATLMGSLPASYPLSSRVLRAVANKNNPAFSEDQLYTIYRAQIPIPNDALTYLTVTHSAKIGTTKATELHQDNNTAAHSDGSGRVEIFLDRTSLPHLILNATHEVVMHGQQSVPEASAAAALEPRAIAIANTGSDSIDSIDFRGRNHRRIVFAISTEQGAVPPAFGYDAEFAFTGPNAFPEWHMILELQNTESLIDTSVVSGATIVGGIRASRNINVVSGNLTIKPQLNYDGYESLLSRNAWIETYFAP